MRKLYDKNELWFALVVIAVYVALEVLAVPVSEKIGIEYSAYALFNIVLTIVLFVWIKNNGLMERYGLCKTTVPARKFLWYIPLVIIATNNLWNGAAINLPLAGTLCYLLYMLCVGFLEEVIFRGFLFKAIAKDNIKQAVIISSVTFGLGHLGHQFDGSGAELVANLCQVFGAIAIGFLFVTIFHRSGSLLPCIITHSAIDMISAFANETGLTDQKRIILGLIKFVIVVTYTLILDKTLRDGRE